MTEHFPDNFLWGAATAAFQIEGAASEDGRGESIWDRFAHTPGKVFGGHTGDRACDHYHRWRDDIRLMQQLGLQAYRFSIAWSRILPEGYGRVNAKGLDFYSRLVDGLLEAGIQPYATLYHWDLPQALQDRGGWPARSTAEAFVEFAELASQHLGDRVASWATLNEPQVSADAGYLQGRHAPGHTSVAEQVATTHHLLLAHGLAVPVLRRNAPQAQVGIVLNLQPHTAASARPEDVQAARIGDALQNRRFLDPLAGRGYPQEFVALDEETLRTVVHAGDLEAIAAPLDFLGVNHYFRTVHRSESTPAEAITVPVGSHKTEMGWEVYPPGIEEILVRLHREYPFPAYYITENGAAFADEVSADGHVHDAPRVEYLRAYLHHTQRAIQAGVPLKGYFAWSLLDNFEWAWGYSRRFGLIYVDFETQTRIIKDSGRLYTQIIKENKLT
ncbi:MAG: beta-glucosidase [Anaerolineales bacterium]|nr:beta-glucosidase [Anaerolineales bacterium]